MAPSHPPVTKTHSLEADHSTDITPSVVTQEKIATKGFKNSSRSHKTVIKSKGMLKHDVKKI